jgi:hypothetical protein
MSKPKTFKVGRKAGPGTFCSVEWARAHPQIAVVETMKRTQRKTSNK